MYVLKIIIFLQRITLYTMKKQSFVLFVLWTQVILCPGQTIFIKPFYSSSFKLAPDYVTSVDENVIISVDTVVYVDTYNNNEFTLGQGKTAGVAGGMYFNDNSEAIELTLSYFQGKTSSLCYKYRLEYNPWSAYSYSLSETDNYRINSLNLGLNYIRQLYFGKISPFIKAGGMLSYVMPEMEVNLFIINTMSGYAPGASRYYYRYQSDRKIIAGANVAAGFELFPESLLSLSFEAGVTFLRYKPEKYTCVEYKANDVDAFDSLPPSEAEIILVDSYTSLENENLAKPRQIAKRNYSVNSKYLNVGVKYRF
jgi:hypothetical protein